MAVKECTPLQSVWPTVTVQTFAEFATSCGFSVTSCVAVRPTDSATEAHVSAQAVCSQARVQLKNTGDHTSPG